jgi:hypothetical protein
MNADPWDLYQHSRAAQGVTATAAHQALRRARELGSGPATPASLSEMFRLTSLVHRIETRLEAGQEALDRGDVDSACLEWASALVLTDRLATIENRAKLVHNRHHQKSGRAG